MNEPSNFKDDRDILLLLGEIKGQLAALIAQAAKTDAEVKRSTQEFKDEHQRLEGRVRVLEQSKAWALGAAAAVGAAAGFLVDMLKS